MRIILSRHGNTFEPDEKVVMAGLKNDLALAQKGELQARDLGKKLKAEGIIPEAFYCSELQRTRRYAEIVIEELGIDATPIVDARINEVDYGNWTGLSDGEIIEKFGQDAVDAWQKYSQWPMPESAWTGTPEEKKQEVLSFCAEIAEKYQGNKTILAVSHGGLIRSFLNLFTPPMAEINCYEYASEQGEFPSWKVKTGNYCILEYTYGNWQHEGWNLPSGV
jgi:probable phosphoglycerate mutase